MIMNILDLQRLYYIPRRVSLLARRNLKRQGFSKVLFIQSCSQAGLLYESVKRVLCAHERTKPFSHSHLSAPQARMRATEWLLHSPENEPACLHVPLCWSIIKLQRQENQKGTKRSLFQDFRVDTRSCEHTYDPIRFINYVHPLLPRLNSFCLSNCCWGIHTLGMLWTKGEMVRYRQEKDAPMATISIQAKPLLYPPPASRIEDCYV